MGDRAGIRARVRVRVGLGLGSYIIFDISSGSSVFFKEQGQVGKWNIFGIILNCCEIQFSFASVEKAHSVLTYMCHC